jgi:hypothetical protein
MGISKNGGNWHLEGFLCYFTCLNLIFVKILGNFQLGHHYYWLSVTGHMLPTTSSNEYAKWPTLDFTIHDDTYNYLPTLPENRNLVY